MEQLIEDASFFDDVRYLSAGLAQTYSSLKTGYSFFRPPPLRLLARGAEGPGQVERSLSSF